MIQGKNTQYRIDMWDNKKIIATINIFGEYAEEYEIVRDVEGLLLNICDYLNKKENKKISILQKIKGKWLSDYRHKPAKLV